jgi:hypothetical protein
MSPNPPSTTTTTTLPPPFLTKILHQARTIASHSWEHSTIFYTLLEHSTPQLSIFNSPFPDNEIPTWEEEDVEALRYIKPFIRVDGDTLSEAREGDSEYQFSLCRFNATTTCISLKNIMLFPFKSKAQSPTR